MVKMRNPFVREEKPTIIPEEPELTLSQLDEKALGEISEQEFRKLVKATENTAELRSRHQMLSRWNQKLASLPLETIEEKRLRRSKVVSFIRLLGEEIRLREDAERKAAVERGKTWVKETVPKILNDLRYNSDHATSLKSGIISLNACQWKKPTDTMITVKLANGEELKFDLTTMPQPLLKTVLNNPFSPIFVPTVHGAMKDGRPYGETWQSKKFDEHENIKVTSDSYLALMRV
jgi:hypothetical protein